MVLPRRWYAVCWIHGKELVDMTVEELINELQKLEDKTLDVRLEYKDEEANKWVERVVERVEAHYQGGSGYELHGEVILVASE